jgi:type VI secretion system secreted protein VgrG
LAGSGITNTGTTTITADAGTYPTPSETGFSTVTFVAGINHDGDSVTQTAKGDLLTAYTDAAGQATTQTISADLGGQTLTAGVYTGAPSLGLTGALTLDGQNNPNSIFIFQCPLSTLTTASYSVVNLTNSAQACNVFWQVGSSATIGTYSNFVGNILAYTSITVTTGATVDGRVLALNGAVTLDTNTIDLKLQVTFTQTGITTDADSNTVLALGGVPYVWNALPSAVPVDIGTTFSW